MPIARYIALQLPGLALVSILLLFLWDQDWISLSTAGAVILILVIKDVILYPFFKPALQQGPQEMTSRLVGCEAVVWTDLSPEGQVYLQGEIWRASSIKGDYLLQGSKVVVVDSQGLTLYVRPVQE